MHTYKYWRQNTDLAAWPEEYRKPRKVFRENSYQYCTPQFIAVWRPTSSANENYTSRADSPPASGLKLDRNAPPISKMPLRLLTKAVQVPESRHGLDGPGARAAA